MGKFFFSLMSTFRYLIILLIFAVINTSSASALECIIANDMGGAYRTVVKANPAGLRDDSGYKQDSKSLVENADELPDDISPSQRADWVDSKVFTSGSDGFYFEIEGSWTPWYGNFKVITDKYGNEITIRANQNQLCILETLNPGSSALGVKGELDYVTSAYDLQEKESGYTKIFLTPENQQPCWLTTGEGLYIAFFGKTGYELPEIATHLKTAVVACDKPYATDKNGDSIITINECYLTGDASMKNMAYYKPYRSEYLIGGIRCDKDFFHGTNINKIGINDCYEEVEKSNGNKEKVDRTIFTFEAPYLYKRKNKDIVRNNERVKFIIYDRYYRDNVGEYVINMYRGVSDIEDEGIIKKILGDLEQVFVGSRNAGGILKNTDAYGKEKDPLLTQVYNYIVKDTIFAWVCRVSIILYMMFLGLQFAMGSLEYKTKELMGILLKLTFILGFTTATSWQVYDYFVVRFFLDGFSDIIVMIANITQKMFDPTAGGVGSGGSMASKFQFIDDSITFLFSDSITRKIQGLFFGVWFGFIVIPIFYILAIYFIYQLVNAIFPYIIMFIQAVLALALGPIFISFYLFKTTEHMFKNWLAFVGARFTNMAFLFLFLFTFSAIIKQQFSKLLFFEVCKVPVLQAATNTDGDVDSVLNFFSFGLKVWDARWTDSYPQPGFIGFCIDLLFIGVLIYLFGMIMKKVPNIIDSMIDIGGESGGGLKRGQSVFGGKQQTLSEALDSSIKVQGKWDGKKYGKDTGIVSRAKGILKDGAKNVAGKAGSGLWDITGGKAINAIKDKVDSNSLMANAMVDSKLKGMDAVNDATDNYKNKILESGRYSGSDVDKKVSEFKSKMEEEYVKDPIRNEMKRVSQDVAKFAASMASQGKPLSADTIERLTKDRMNDFIGKELAMKPDQIGDYAKYYENSSLLKNMKFAADERGDTGKLSQSEYLRTQREFKLQEASSRLGISGENMNKDNKVQGGKINEYNQNMLGRLNREESYTDRKHHKKNAKKYERDLDRLKGKKNLVEEHAAVMKEQERLVKAQYSSALKEKADLLKRQEKLTAELDGRRKQQERDNLDKEISRMKKLSEDTKLQEGIRERAKNQMEALEKRKAENVRELELRKKLDEAANATNKLINIGQKGKTQINDESAYNNAVLAEKKIKDELKALNESRTKYEDLAKVSDQLNKDLNGRGLISKVDSVREDEAIKKELQRENLGEDRKNQLESLQTKKNEIQNLEKIAAGAQGKQKDELQNELDMKKKELDEDRKRLLQNADKDSLYNKEAIVKVDEDLERLSKLKERAEGGELNTKIDDQLRDLKDLEGKRKELEELGDSDPTKKSRLEKEIDDLSLSVSKRSDEIDGTMDLSNHLRDNKIDDESLKLRKEIEDIKVEDAVLQNNLREVVEEAKNITTISDIGDKHYEAQGSVNLAVEGLGEDFGIKGITGLGLGEDNKDLIGFGKGAASAILGSDFEGTSSSKDNVDNTADVLNRTKLRMAKQQHKILQFQLAQAESSGDEKAVDDIKEQIKEAKKQIRIIQDDVDDD